MMLDLLIVGSGPAGLTAAVYAARAGLRAEVLERSTVPGGRIATAGMVENYPGIPRIDGYSLGTQLREHAVQAGAVFRSGIAKGIERGEGCLRLMLDEGEPIEAGAILASTGAVPRYLGIKGEGKYRGQGVSYCATCDGAFFRGKTVYVIGGGEDACDDVLTLARLAAEVVMVFRSDAPRAPKNRVHAIEALENVTLLPHTEPVEILGGVLGVNALRLRDTHTGEEREAPTNGVFVSTGVAPVSDWLQDTGLLDADGYVTADENGVTAFPGLFAAGDLRRKALRQVITAAADGANAVHAVEGYLSER